MIVKDTEGSDLIYYPYFCLEKLKKATINQVCDLRFETGVCGAADVCE
jgi:hypothetical protein